jgi:hypothetical protein
MNTLLLALSLDRKSDLLLARQAARRAAELLGFDQHDQVCLASATFDLACQAMDLTEKALVRFEIDAEVLHVRCIPAIRQLGAEEGEEATSLRISKQLPTEAPVSRVEVPWMLEQMVNLTPRNAFAEVRRLNQELLGALLELAATRVKQPAAAAQSEPNAA